MRSALIFTVIGVSFVVLDRREVTAQMPHFGVIGGVVSNTRSNAFSESWLIIGGVMELSLPMMPFALQVSAEYSWDTDKYNDVVVWPYPYRVITFSERDIKIGVGGKYTWSIPASPVGFYVGGGPGIHMYSWEKKFDVREPESGFDTWVSIHFFGGMELSIGGRTLFGEIGWGKIFPKEDSWTQFVFAGGIKF